MNVERTDFVSVFTQDIQRAKQFYGETLVTEVCRMAFFKDPDGNALLLHRRFDA
jgi:predicted enzyme related to lactoylglutathione lyase